MIESRYPYTYACDYIRTHGPKGERIIERIGFRAPLLSRSDASHLRQAISAALEMDDELLAKKLADKHLSENPE